MEKTVKSKLANVGTSIFTEMSVLANQCGAINLSQGFPEFDTPDFLKAAVEKAINEGKNQYAPSQGMPGLLSELGQLIYRQYGVEIEPLENITVTSGATEAIWVAIQTIVRPGDEVIVFDPCYDSYEPSVNLAGGSCVHIPLNAPDYQVDWQQVKNKVNDKTRAIMVNSPHNPTGTLLSFEDMLALQSIAKKNDLYVISDEVYEFITFDGKRHESVLRFPELFERSFVLSSFGKTFHCTGWKLGYCTAPAGLTREFRKIHQFVTFSSFTPGQLGVAAMLKDRSQHVEELHRFYQEKRDVLVEALSGSRFKILPSSGTYFLLVDYSEISQQSDREFCNWLTKEIGVAAIPLSPFYAEAPDSKVIRLCFAKNDSTLKEAAQRLCQL